MKKILVPTDFSQPAQWALETAIGIAKKANAQLILLHIIEQPTAESFNAEGQVADEEGWEEKHFTLKLIEKSKAQMAVDAKLAEAEGVQVKTELRLGNPFHAIKTVITEHAADLIVMGALGRSRPEELIVGSNAEKVVRHAKCPVLTVQRKPSAKGFSRIAYASALDIREKDFAAVVKNAQEMFGATVHLVRINTPNNFKSDHEVKRVMNDFAKKVNLQNCTLNVYNDNDEENGILHFASAIDADLIAMATHGRTGVAHLIVGSIAEEVVSHSSRPVLTYVTPDLYR
jgi:nucleotide-binding universal stress UspA family protein